MKPFKEKVLHVTGALFGQHKLRDPQDSWDDGSRLLSEGSSTDPAHLTSFEGGPLGTVLGTVMGWAHGSDRKHCSQLHRGRAVLVHCYS